MSIDQPEYDQGLSAVYAANTTDGIVRFTSSEKTMLFAALNDVIRQFRSRIRIFSPLCSIEALTRHYGGDNGMTPTYGCRGGVDFFFVNAADGNVYPCGYRGNENFGRMEEVDVRKLNPPGEADACRQCDWECFRDPSELFGPLLGIGANPLQSFRRALQSPRTIQTWIEDLLYYRACDLFNGRRPPNTQRLRRFIPSERRRRQIDRASLAGHRINQKLSVT
jgi:hypothetical protein